MWRVAHTVVAPPSSGVKCLWERCSFGWGWDFFFVCLGCCSYLLLIVCVCVGAVGGVVLCRCVCVCVS